MTDKLTDAEVKKALECCSQSGDFTKTQDEICSPCPYSNCGDCTGLLKANALDLINRQEEMLRKSEKVELLADKTISTLQTENESLKAEVERLKKETKKFKEHYKMACSERNEFLEYLQTAKAEAYKECIAKIKNYVKTRCNPYGKPIFDYDTSVKILSYLDNLLNELVGEENEL